MPTKSGTTRVVTSKLVAISNKLGLTVEPKAGWFLAYHPSNRKARLLVHTGKKGTNCIELVGFESPEAIKHPCPPAKTMTQMLDCNLDEKVILRNFYKTAKSLVPAPAKQEPSQEPTQAPVEEPASQEA